MFEFQTAIWVLVGVGGLLFVTGFLGCCGAACENRCLLGLFFGIVLVLFVGELSAGIAVIVKQDAVKNVLAEGLTEALKEDKTALNGVMDKYKCCAINGTAPSTAPDICVNAKTAGMPGCLDKLWADLKSNIVPVGGVAIGVLVIELLAMIFSCVMCNAIGSKSGYAYA